MLFIIPLFITSAVAVAAGPDEGARVALGGRAQTKPVAYQVSGSAPNKSMLPVSSSYMSFSVEFSTLMQTVGTVSSPNNFTDDLLDNFVRFAGEKPIVRVGGNTQDQAIYVATQKEPIVRRNSSMLTIGPGFFDLYNALPGVLFSHGFNLKDQSPQAWQTLLDTVPLACKAMALHKDKPRLFIWEYGNEPHLYPRYKKGSDVNAKFTAEWLKGARKIAELTAKHCPANATDGYIPTGFLGPSTGSPKAALNLKDSWAAGLFQGDLIKLISKHNYMAGSEGSTLENTLLKHSLTVQKLNEHAAEYKQILDRAMIAKNPKTPTPLARLEMGEYNSIWGGGKHGVSNVFGAALWNLDFALYAASVGFRRIHLHQGVGAHYNAWQPVDSKGMARQVAAPYYGSIAVAASLGNTATHKVTVASLGGQGVSKDSDAAYAVYQDGRLVRIVVVNLRSFRTMKNGTFSLAGRGTRTYTFTISGMRGKTAHVQRLMASGSDSTSGITFDGMSYSTGRPERAANVSIGQQLPMAGDVLKVEVPDSSAALLNFK